MWRFRLFANYIGSLTLRRPRFERYRCSHCSRAPRKNSSSKRMRARPDRGRGLKLFPLTPCGVRYSGMMLKSLQVNLPSEEDARRQCGSHSEYGAVNAGSGVNCAGDVEVLSHLGSSRKRLPRNQELLPLNPEKCSRPAGVNRLLAELGLSWLFLRHKDWR